MDHDTIQSDGFADKVVEHEEAAHEKRNWVRLTFDCNDHCVFCLDTDAHDGRMRDRGEITQQILDGRRKGAERLILSGGEPTIHPDFVDFIRLGRAASYRWIQTVTNGRLFAYPDFLGRSLDAGLDEITFSLHGHTAKIHDALVGVPGAFEQETRGLRQALADGRPVVNIDICVNRANVKHLPEMLETFISWGVREFDLLQVIPFGNAFKDGRDILFYDLQEAQPYLQRALAISRRPDIHLWMNRFPPPHLEGYEALIQDPYKLNDEVKGRREEYAGLLDEGIDLVCREPARCRYCYLQPLCDHLYGVAGSLNARSFVGVRVDAQWEQQQRPVWGGDPASRRKAAQRSGRGALPILNQSAEIPAPRHAPLEEIVRDAAPATLWVRAPGLSAVPAILERYPGPAELELELDDYADLAAALGPGDRLWGRRLVRARAGSAAQAQALLACDGAFQVAVALTRETEPWLLSLSPVPARLALRQPSYERVSEARRHDVDLHAFFARFGADVPVEGIPACISGRAPVVRAGVLDTAMTGPDGRLEIFRYAQRYILEHYRTKSLRCAGCVHEPECPGMHINFIRAHGYAVLRPVETAAEAAAG